MQPFSLHLIWGAAQSFGEALDHLAYSLARLAVVSKTTSLRAILGSIIGPFAKGNLNWDLVVEGKASLENTSARRVAPAYGQHQVGIRTVDVGSDGQHPGRCMSRG
jgi:hypothetical protein